MNTIMDDEAMDSMDRIREFLSGALRVKFEVADTREAYPWIAKTLVRFDYLKCVKPERGLVFQNLSTWLFRISLQRNGTASLSLRRRCPLMLLRRPARYGTTYPKP